MKIALVHMRHAGTGGTERYMNQLAAYLAERGDDVTIVCRTHESPPHPSVRFVKLHGLAVGGAWRMQTFAQEVEQHVAEVHYDVVYGLGKTWSHDVVRLGGGCHATYLELAHDATMSREKRMFAIGALKHRMALKIEALALRPSACRLIVVNSNMVKKDVMRRYGIPSELVRLIYNGVDVERFHPRLRATTGAELRRTSGFTDTDRVVLFLGTGYGRKGLDLVIAGVALAAARDPRIKLLVVGYDSEQSRYEKLAADAGIAERARFLGGRRDAETCYAASDVYVLPTRYDPFANTTLEALASGLPVITSAFNGACELVEAGRCGTVLDGAGDAESIAAAILAWIDPARDTGGESESNGNTPPAARSINLAARALAERHTAASKARETAEMLDEVVAEKRAVM